VGVTDESGNGNDWTNNNLNLSTSTATTYDQMKDTPSLVDENAGNFAVINPIMEETIIRHYSVFRCSTLVVSPSGKWYGNNAISTVVPASELWYAEFTATGNVPYGEG
jgi:hypothetical protein